MAALLFAIATWPATENAQQPHTTWRTYLGSADASHYSALKQINRANVDKLEVAWSYATGDDRAYEFSPIVVGKIMYVLAQRTSIVALDAATGRQLWVYHPKDVRPLEMHRGINFWQSQDGSEQRLLISFSNRLPGPHRCPHR